jgi:hypothetical protein
LPTLTNHLEGQNLTGILAAGQARQWLHELEAKPGVEILAEPEVITTSGRQTQMRATETLTVVSGLKPGPDGQKNGGTNNTIPFTTTNEEFGPVFDVVPWVLGDDYTIDMTVIASISHFAGYDTPTNSEGGFNLNQRPGLPAVHPVILHHEFVTQVNLYDGQALLLYETQPRALSFRSVPDLNHPNAGTINGGKKWHLLVLTMVNIVDPAGNRVHTDEELPFARDHVPPPARPGVPLDDRPFDVPPGKVSPDF